MRILPLSTTPSPRYSLILAREEATVILRREKKEAKQHKVGREKYQHVHGFAYIFDTGVEIVNTLLACRDILPLASRKLRKAEFCDVPMPYTPTRTQRSHLPVEPLPCAPCGSTVAGSPFCKKKKESNRNESKRIEMNRNETKRNEFEKMVGGRV